MCGARLLKSFCRFGAYAMIRAGCAAVLASGPLKLGPHNNGTGAVALSIPLSGASRVA